MSIAVHRKPLEAVEIIQLRRPLTPKQLRETARQGDYRGRQANVMTADYKCEPRRSEELRKLRVDARWSVTNSLSSYREAVRQRYLPPIDDDITPEEIQWQIDWWAKNLLWDFGTLLWIEELLTYQLDLFEC